MNKQKLPQHFKFDIYEVLNDTTYYMNNRDKQLLKFSLNSIVNYKPIEPQFINKTCKILDNYNYCRARIWQ